MSADDQLYKNEHGFIGWIDQQMMLFARDIAVLLRWITGKGITETINYLWWTTILIAIVSFVPIIKQGTKQSLFLLVFAIVFSLSCIKKWRPFGDGIVIEEYGTRIPIAMKYMAFFGTFLIPPGASVIFLFLEPNLLFPFFILSFAFFYYHRVALPPPKRKTVPEKVKELLARLKPVPKPITNSTPS